MPDEPFQLPSDTQVLDEFTIRSIMKALEAGEVTWEEYTAGWSTYKKAVLRRQFKIIERQDRQRKQQH